MLTLLIVCFNLLMHVFKYFSNIWFYSTHIYYQRISYIPATVDAAILLSMKRSEVFVCRPSSKNKRATFYRYVVIQTIAHLFDEICYIDTILLLYWHDFIFEEYTKIFTVSLNVNFSGNYWGLVVLQRHVHLFKFTKRYNSI
jgi:hypothetical protein